MDEEQMQTISEGLIVLGFLISSFFKECRKRWKQYHQRRWLKRQEAAILLVPNSHPMRQLGEKAKLPATSSKHPHLRIPPGGIPTNLTWSN